MGQFQKHGFEVRNPGFCYRSSLWASAPFDLYCSVSVSEREMKVLII